MGISSSKSKSTNKPIYNSQIEGAGTALTDAYKTNQPNIQHISDQISGLVPGMIDKYNAGDAGVNAARDYNVGVLGGKYLDAGNPYLQQQINQTNNDVTNTLGARLAKMGLSPGGSSYQDVVSKNLAANENNLRFGDYNAERGRMATAAGQAPGLAAADVIGISPLLGVADAANNPLQSAVGYASGLGGLLGQYQNTKTKSSSPWGPALLGGLGNAAAAFAGG